MTNRAILYLLVSCLLFPFGSIAQEKAVPKRQAKIAWFGTWKGGLAEATRSGKPILLVSAAPQCHSVPGVW